MLGYSIDFNSPIIDGSSWPISESYLPPHKRGLSYLCLTVTFIRFTKTLLRLNVHPLVELSEHKGKNVQKLHVNETSAIVNFHLWGVYDTDVVRLISDKKPVAC